MYIMQVYKYIINGITYVGSIDVPSGAEIIEKINMLNAEEGQHLKRISDNENVGSSIWLHNGDVQENYIEEGDI